MKRILDYRIHPVFLTEAELRFLCLNHGIETENRSRSECLKALSDSYYLNWNKEESRIEPEVVAVFEPNFELHACRTSAHSIQQLIAIRATAGRIKSRFFLLKHRFELINRSKVQNVQRYDKVRRLVELLATRVMGGKGDTPDIGEPFSLCEENATSASSRPTRSPAVSAARNLSLAFQDAEDTDPPVPGTGRLGAPTVTISDSDTIVQPSSARKIGLEVPNPTGSKPLATGTIPKLTGEPTPGQHGVGQPPSKFDFEVDQLQKEFERNIGPDKRSTTAIPSPSATVLSEQQMALVNRVVQQRLQAFTAQQAANRETAGQPKQQTGRDYPSDASDEDDDPWNERDDRRDERRDRDRERYFDRRDDRRDDDPWPTRRRENGRDDRREYGDPNNQQLVRWVDLPENPIPEVNYPNTAYNHSYGSRTVKFYRHPVSYWNLTFSGDGDDKGNLEDFLKDVEIHARGDKIPLDSVLDGVHHLLKGPAKLIFDTNRQDIEYWDDLVHHLRIAFDTSDYQARLRLEAQNIQQKIGESFALYLARARRVFSRVRPRLTRWQEFDLLLAGLLEKYAAVCRSRDIYNLRDLQDAARVAERNIHRMGRNAADTKKKVQQDTQPYRGKRFNKPQANEIAREVLEVAFDPSENPGTGEDQLLDDEFLSEFDVDEAEVNAAFAANQQNGTKPNYIPAEPYCLINVNHKGHSTIECPDHPNKDQADALKALSKRRRDLAIQRRLQGQNAVRSAVEQQNFRRGLPPQPRR